MISINKKNEEPNLLVKFREKRLYKKGKIEGNDYKLFQNTESEGFKQLQKSLLEEQKYLCCYCMSEIDENNISIDHYKPKDSKKDYGKFALTYSNLLASCKKNHHCNIKKGNKELNILPNPSDSTVNFRHIIDYSNGGHIKIKDSFLIQLEEKEKKNYLDDINDILNLNNDELVNARLTKVNAIIKIYNNDRSKKPQLKKAEFFESKCIIRYGAYHGYIESVLLKKNLK